MSDFLGLEIVNRDNTDEFSIPGVWALFGKRKGVDNNKWYCLQVAETTCVKNEIEKDIQLIESGLNECGEKILYVNQFGELLFSYYRHPSAREYLYSKYIKEEFKDFQFVLICKENDRTKRRSIEKEFAYRTNAVYWRNGGPFRTGDEIDYERRMSITEGIPNNGNVSKTIIIPFVERYNKQ